MGGSCWLCSPQGRGRSPVRPQYLLLQPTHPLPVGPLPSLQGAFCLHLGTAQALHLLLQLQLLLLLLRLQPGWAVVLLQHHHLGLQERPLIWSLAPHVCMHTSAPGALGTSPGWEPGGPRSKASAGRGCRESFEIPFVLPPPRPSWPVIRVPSDPYSDGQTHTHRCTQAQAHTHTAQKQACKYLYSHGRIHVHKSLIFLHT